MTKEELEIQLTLNTLTVKQLAELIVNDKDNIKKLLKKELHLCNRIRKILIYNFKKNKVSRWRTRPIHQLPGIHTYFGSVTLFIKIHHALDIIGWPDD